MSSGYTRRSWLKLTSKGTFGLAAYPWFSTVARAAAEAAPQLTKPKYKQCIFYTMNGGPSQVNTFDPKPGGAIPAIETPVAGIQVCENYPHLAKLAPHLAFLRGMSFKRANHDGGITVHSGYPTKFAGGVSRPTIGAIIAKEIADPQFELPLAVRTGPGYYNAGFLGARYAPFNYNPGNTSKTGPIPDRMPSVAREEFDRRIDFIEALNRQFYERHGADSTQGHTAAYRGAQRLVHTDKVDAFDLSKEPDSVLERYGFFDKLSGAFAKPQHEGEKNNMKLHAQCLTARRLIEVGVPFVEIGGGGWDSHAGVLDGSYQDHRFMGGLMDKPVTALITDLKDRGLLDNVLIALVGEFGRQGLNGTNHNNKAFTAVLAGAGLKTGQVIGATDKTGDNVTERPVTEHEFLATMLKALGIDPDKEYTVSGRPITLVDPGTRPVVELF